MNDGIWRESSDGPGSSLGKLVCAADNIHFVNTYGGNLPANFAISAYANLAMEGAVYWQEVEGVENVDDDYDLDF